ncbi:MAG: hypothetical protein ABSH01_18715 [Terriglobia bacterium]
MEIPFYEGAKLCSDYLLGTMVSLLPKSYRSCWAWATSADFRRATILSGIIETVLCGVIYVSRYIYFIQYRTGTIADAAMKRGGGEEVLASMAAQFGMGFTTLAEYVFSPLSLLLCYFALEGTLRAFSAALTEDTPGTLPLHVLGWSIERVQRWRAEKALGPRVVDEVHRFTGISYDLGIASCRPKKWGRLLTIEFEGKFYELYEEKRGVPPRPYLYFLRENPKGKVIRGPHHYHPEEVLRKPKK